MFLTPDQTLRRKIQEAALAYRLEAMLTKDEVLELYLNRIYFGANTFGLDGAARTYFDKPASQLTLGEAALLAALPKTPSRMALHRNMERAQVRQRLVLRRMREENWITDEMTRRSPRRRSSRTALANDGDNIRARLRHRRGPEDGWAELARPGRAPDHRHQAGHRRPGAETHHRGPGKPAAPAGAMISTT